MSDSDSNGHDDGKALIQNARLYVAQRVGWEAHIKRTAEKEYCYLQSSGDEHFHLLMGGEIYLQRGDEKFCLDCALRHGYITTDRLHWQRGPDSVKNGSTV